MRTDELIAALAADKVKARGPAWQLAAALAVGLFVSCLILLATLGIRADIAAAMRTWRFDLKMLLLLLGLALAALACRRTAAPDAVRPGHVLWIIPVALLAAVAVELLAVPPSAWVRQLVGTNALVCLVSIPILGLAPLGLVLIAMRTAAPASSAAAGALAGLSAATAAAALYGLHCFDDSPLFVATWYTLASLPLIGLGALAGTRLLRW